MDKYDSLRKYFDLLIETEEFILLSKEQTKNLSKYIDSYYNDIIDLFDGLDKMIKEYIKNGNISLARKVICDRFSDESLEYDLKQCSDKALYKDTFFKLKEEYMMLIDNYQDMNIQKKCYNRISYILNSLQNQRKCALYGIDVRNKNDIIKNIRLSLMKIKFSFDKETLDTLENIESLVEYLVSLQINPSIKSTREMILNKLAISEKMEPFGILNNRLVSLVNSCSENNYKTYVYNVDAMNVYKSIYEDILCFVLDNINSKEGKEYFKKLIIDNLSNFIVYDSKNNITSVNIVNLKKLFDLVSNVMLIEELSMFDNIEFQKLEQFNMKGFKTVVNEIEKTGNNKEQLECMYSLYKESLASHCSSSSVLNLFYHK